MAYEFKSDESIPEGIRRIAAEQVDEALEIMSGRPPDRDKAVHEARKSIKKLRALVRLVETELGETFDTENTRLRDAGRELSRFRDAAAMIQTFDDVREKYGKDLPDHGLQTIRSRLAAQKRRGERRESVQAALAAAARELRDTRKRSKHWPLRNDGFPALSDGIERALRRGRSAMEKAQKSGAAEDYHAWRKRVKDHWYHVRLLRHVWKDVMDGFEKSLKSLEDDLGTDHNLNVLVQRVKAEPDFFGTPEQVNALCLAVEHFQKDLHDSAGKIGIRMYGEKPKLIVRRFGHWWQEWKQVT